MKTITQIALASLVGFVVGSCSPFDGLKSLPEANDKNCETEVILKIKDEQTRQKFASMCARRTTPYKPSTPMRW